MSGPARQTPERAQSTELEPFRLKKYTPQTVEIALLTLAMCGDNSGAAVRTLAAKGIKVEQATLKTWRQDQFPNRYRDIAERHRGAIEGEIVSNVRSMALRASEIAQRALDLEEKRIASEQVSDASASLRNIATSIGISVDKILLLEGRPNQITEQRSSDDVLRGLTDRGYIDSTAEEADAGPAHRPPSR